MGTVFQWVSNLFFRHIITMSSMYIEHSTHVAVKGDVDEAII